MAAVQGVIGLLLAVMGLYAVVSSRRHPADSRDRRAHGARCGAAATCCGSSCARACDCRSSALHRPAGRVRLWDWLLSRVLYGLVPVDVAVLAGVTLLLLVVSALACYLPARRATRGRSSGCFAIRVMACRSDLGSTNRMTLNPLPQH